MKLLKRVLAILAATVGLSANAGSYSDLWWNPSEGGWGINLIQQHNTIFATMFVYGTDGKTSWYVASDMKATNITRQLFTGELYETTGPYFGGAFNPTSVTVRPVGRITFDAAASTTGAFATLTYSVDGVSVTKSIRRQTWASIPVGGRYWASLVNYGVENECSGIGLSTLDDFLVTEGGTISIGRSTGAAVCQVAGEFTQDGSLKKIVNGTVSCPSINFSGRADIVDWRVEGGVAGLVALDPIYMTGVLILTGPNNCKKLYQFTGQKRF